MGCGCNKKRVKKNTKNYQTLLDSLKKELVKFRIRTNNGFKEVVGSLNKEILPSMKSRQFEHVNINDQITKDKLVFWALNKNFLKDVEPSSGWCTITLSSIDDYEVLT